MEKCVVEKLISTQSDRVRLCKNSGTSEVWKYFETVEIDGKLKHLTASPGDKAAVTHLKVKLRLCIASHYRISPMHHVASLLDPHLKYNASILPDATRLEALSVIREMLTMFQILP